MPVVVVANPKGGVGKSTLATNIAGYWAHRGHAVMLGDIDVQQSSRLWLQLRPPAARPITCWEVSSDFLAQPPRGTTHVVLDTPAGLEGIRLRRVTRLADRVLVPLAPGIFDIYATRRFVDELAALQRTRDFRIGLVAMRVDDRTLAAKQLERFMQTLDAPVVGWLRSTQNYVQLAARGLTLFDVAPGRVLRDLEQWHELCRWLDRD